MPELFLNMERIRLRCWHQPNTKLKIPKAFTFLKFYCDEANGLKSSCLNSLMAFVIRDCLSEVSYKAQLAGLFYTLRPVRNGLELEVRGISAKQDVFLEKILKVIFDCGGQEVLSQERFQTVHGLYMNGLQRYTFIIVFFNLGLNKTEKPNAVGPPNTSPMGPQCVPNAFPMKPQRDSLL